MKPMTADRRRQAKMKQVYKTTRGRIGTGKAQIAHQRHANGRGFGQHADMRG
jgi:hypothetical protein